MNIANERVPVFRPLIGLPELKAAQESLSKGWLGMGSYVKLFEEGLGAACGIQEQGSRAVVAVNTGHAALHLALLQMGVGPGDEVITPAFNNAADFQAILACGAEPVFADILDQTLCVDPQRVAELVGPRTKAIIAMDYDIFLCDHDALKAITRAAGIPVLHDAAHSFGSNYKGIPIGNQHQYTIFSFDPVKTITAIDGGALITSDISELEELHQRRLIGMSQSADVMYRDARAWTYDIKGLGFRYHLSNIHAAIGLAQLDQLDVIRTSRQKTCARFSHEMSGLSHVSAPSTDYSSINPFLFYVRVRDGRRDEFRQHLDLLGVDTGIHWPAGHKFTRFRGCKKGSLGVTEQVASDIVSLPLHSCMAESDEDRVIDAVRGFK